MKSYYPTSLLIPEEIMHKLPISAVLDTTLQKSAVYYKILLVRYLIPLRINA